MGVLRSDLDEHLCHRRPFFVGRLMLRVPRRSVAPGFVHHPSPEHTGRGETADDSRVGRRAAPAVPSRERERADPPTPLPKAKVAEEGRLRELCPPPARPPQHDSAAFERLTRPRPSESLCEERSAQPPQEPTAGAARSDRLYAEHRERQQRLEHRRVQAP